MAASDEALHALAQHLVGETDGEPPDVQLGPNGLYLVSGTGGGPTVVGGPEPPQLSLAEAQAQLPQAQAPVPRATDAFAKAATIGASRVGERYATPSLAEILAMPNPLIGIAEYLVGAGRPRSVAAADPSGIEAWSKGAGAPPVMMGTIDTVPGGVAATLGDLASKGGDSVREALATIKAYHGSPHDFAAFDANKIGTGEGAQAYGHGLYLAERESTAQVYRDSLVQPQIGGIPAETVYKTEPQSIYDVLRGLKASDPNATIEQAAKAWDAIKSRARVVDNVVSYGTSARMMMRHDPAAVALYDEMVKTGELVFPKGHMYEVGIKADPAQFLDWDQPLSQQHPAVQQALQSANAIPSSYAQQLAETQAKIEDLQGAIKLYQPRVDLPGARGEMAAREIRKLEAELNYVKTTAARREADYTGQTLYQSLAHDIQGETMQSGQSHMPIADAKVEAARRIQAAGIPGIKYLDQGSRTAGEGTRNYVVFPGNEHLIDILKKYGLFVPAGGLAALEAKRQAEQAGGHGSVTQ